MMFIHCLPVTLFIYLFIGMIIYLLIRCEKLQVFCMYDNKMQVVAVVVVVVVKVVVVIKVEGIVKIEAL